MVQMKIHFTVAHDNKVGNYEKSDQDNDIGASTMRSKDKWFQLINLIITQP